MKLRFGDPESIKLRDESILIDRLIALDKQLSTRPWMSDEDENIGENWLVAQMGYSNIDGKTYIVTTDHVRASEVDGDAKTDSAGIAELRNLLPRIIELVKLATR